MYLMLFKFVDVFDEIGIMRGSLQLLPLSILVHIRFTLIMSIAWFIGCMCMLAGGGLYASHSEIDIRGDTYMAFNDAYDGGERLETSWSDACYATNNVRVPLIDQM